MFKATTTDVVDEYSIIFGTCDAEDEALFKSPYVNGATLVYTRGNVYFVSGNFVKTVNSVGPDSNGNVNVSGSGSSDIPVINKGTSDTTITIDPNKIYIWDEVSSLDISLAAGSTTTANHYFFQFKSGSKATTLALPDTVIYIGNSKIEKNKTYQVSILNDIAILGGASLVTVKAVVDFNISTDIGQTISSTYSDMSFDTTDSAGNTVTFNIIAGGSNWNVGTGAYSYTIGETSYNSSYQLNFGTGSTTSRCVQVTLDGPCTIYIAGRRSSNSSKTIYAYVDGTSIGSFSPTSSTSVTVGTINYTGDGGTLAVYGSGTIYLYHIEIDYNV